ncbi:hypothetical protein MRB53_040396 [Persea americana]|nr:hypothetical protein MRB53_040396 [Persea americana]
MLHPLSTCHSNSDNQPTSSNHDNDLPTSRVPGSRAAPLVLSLHTSYRQSIPARIDHTIFPDSTRHVQSVRHFSRRSATVRCFCDRACAVYFPRIDRAVHASNHTLSESQLRRIEAQLHLSCAAQHLCLAD